MEYKRNTPLAKQMYSPMRQDQPTELGFNDFSPEDIVNAYIAHYKGWMSLEEAEAIDAKNKDATMNTYNWQISHSRSNNQKMVQLWSESTTARTKLGAYTPTLEDFERAQKELKNPAL